MEWDNFQRGMNSKNHPGELLPLAKEMKDSHLDFKNKEVFLDFIQKKTASLNLNLADNFFKIKNNWKKIGTESTNRMNVLFKESLMHDITVYLTISSRCGYNIDQHYFFVNMFSESTNLIILHELLHFYTYQTILPMFKERELDYDKFNDYKEALTFLLNTNFGDLLNGVLDKGYEKQKDLRVYIERNWPNFNNVIDFSKFVIENYY